MVSGSLPEFMDFNLFGFGPFWWQTESLDLVWPTNSGSGSRLAILAVALLSDHDFWLLRFGLRLFGFSRGCNTYVALLPCQTDPKFSHLEVQQKVPHEHSHPLRLSLVSSYSRGPCIL